MGASGSRTDAAVCRHLLSPLFVLKLFPCPLFPLGAGCPPRPFLTMPPCHSPPAWPEQPSNFVCTSACEMGDRLAAACDLAMSSMARGCGREKGCLGLVCSMCQLPIFPAMPVLGLLCRAQKQVKPGPGLQGAVMPVGTFSARKRGAALRGRAYCRGRSAVSPVGWPCPSPLRAWVSLTEGGWGHPSAIAPAGWSLHPAPGAAGRVGGRGMCSPRLQPPRPHGHLHINGLQRGVCRGSRP